MPASASSLVDSVRVHAGADVRADLAVAGPGLLEAFALIPDPRPRRGVRHRLVTVLAVSVCAVPAGARSLVAIAEWAADLPVQVRGVVGIVAGPPCESTIRRVLGALDADGLDRVVGAWVAGQLPEPVGRRAVAIYGKTLRGSGSGSGQIRAGRHLLAAVDHDTRAVLGQVDVEGETNEITVFAPLLDAVASAGVDPAGVVVTADALHTQRDHVAYPHEHGAHWILTVKGNQPTPHRHLRDLPWRQVQVAHRQTGRGHGRREIRTVKIVTITAGIAFPHATRAIQLLRRTQPPTGGRRWRTETVHAISSFAPHHASPAQLAAWIRGHRQIENSLHRVRDVAYGEDHSQVRTGNTPQVMSTPRNLTISALRLAGQPNITAALRHHTRDPIRPLQLLKILH